MGLTVKLNYRFLKKIKRDSTQGLIYRKHSEYGDYY